MVSRAEWSRPIRDVFIRVLSNLANLLEDESNRTDDIFEAVKHGRGLDGLIEICTETIPKKRSDIYLRKDLSSIYSRVKCQEWIDALSKIPSCPKYLLPTADNIVYSTGEEGESVVLNLLLCCTIILSQRVKLPTGDPYNRLISLLDIGSECNILLRPCTDKVSKIFNIGLLLREHTGVFMTASDLLTLSYRSKLGSLEHQKACSSVIKTQVTLLGLGKSLHPTGVLKALKMRRDIWDLNVGHELAMLDLEEIISPGTRHEISMCVKPNDVSRSIDMREFPEDLAKYSQSISLLGSRDEKREVKNDGVENNSQLECIHSIDHSDAIMNVDKDCDLYSPSIKSNSDLNSVVRQLKISNSREFALTKSYIEKYRP